MVLFIPAPLEMPAEEKALFQDADYQGFFYKINLGGGGESNKQQKEIKSGNNFVTATSHTVTLSKLTLYAYQSSLSKPHN